jgi:hypothetical protein
MILQINIVYMFYALERVRATRILKMKFLPSGVHNFPKHLINLGKIWYAFITYKSTPSSFTLCLWIITIWNLSSCLFHYDVLYLYSDLGYRKKYTAPSSGNVE